jgi:class 3 adenylate cyclase/methyl-accepting chemotaxis protein
MIKMFENIKLKTKVLLSFFAVTVISASATTAFSIYYFSDKIKSEALLNLRTNATVAEMLFDNRQKELRRIVTTLVEDGAFQLLVGLNLAPKINTYIEDEKKIFQHQRAHNVIVVSPTMDVIAASVAPDYKQSHGMALRAGMSHNLLVRAALAEQRSVVAPEIIPSPAGDLLTISAAAPMYQRPRGSASADKIEPTLIGAVLVRYIFNDNHHLAEEINSLLKVDAALFYNATAISYKSTQAHTIPRMELSLYEHLIEVPGQHEMADFHRGGRLAQYKTLLDYEQRPLGVLGITIPADPFLDTLESAINKLVFIMLLCILGAGLLGYILAQSILNPISQLLKGVQRITSGELNYEIELALKDELGTLASAFNSMSRQLSGLFNTLEQRVQDATKKLQNTLSHLGAIIDNMADGLLVTDTHNKVIRVNPALLHMLPNAQEIIGKPCCDLTSELAELSERAKNSVSLREMEISLGPGRYGHAVASAIVRKDSFADEDEDSEDSSRYTGSRYLGSVILIRDITREKEIDVMLQSTIDTLTRVGTALSAEHNLDKLLEMFVSEARKISYADGGTLYILKNNMLHFEIVQNDSMGIRMGGTSSNPITMPPLPLEESWISAYAALHKEVIYAADVYKNQNFNFSGTRAYDSKTGYKTSAMLVIPLLDRSDNTVGVLQLINPRDPKTGAADEFTKTHTDIVYSLASQAAVAIENVRSQEKIERKNRAFERFVPTEFLRHLGKEEVEDIVIGDASQEHMSVLFSDIRGFTSLSETLSAEDNFLFLNEYLTLIGPSIVNNGGFIDKYIGDAIMALFPQAGVKSSADLAVAAGVGMVMGLGRFNNLHRHAPPLAIGVGIHTGALILGTIGFETRMESTVIGDTVNLASRMEGLTKQYGITIGISGATHAQLSDPDAFLIRQLDTVQVKGKQEAVTIYEVFNGDPPALLDAKLKTLADFNHARELYFAREWEAALSLFEHLQTNLPQDKTVLLYQERCRYLLSNPSAQHEWSGVTRLKEK